MLRNVLEAQLIPRLMMALRFNAQALPGHGPEKPPFTISVDDLVDVLLTGNDADLATLIWGQLEQGCALDTLYLEMLAPAARALGRRWEEDLCDFTQVTMGLWRLHKLVHDFSAQFLGDVQAGNEPQPRILLAAAPDSQHTFGLIVVSEFFRRDGWAVSGGPDLNEAQILSQCADQWLDVLGLSIGSECHLGRARSVILHARRQARNTSMAVMVGGSICDGSSDLAVNLGADLASNDAIEAIKSARQLVSLARSRPGAHSAS